jgi:nucleoid-associated protein YgaU
MQLNSSMRRIPQLSQRTSVPCLVLVILTSPFAGQSRGQDVAEAARQERARKEKNPQAARHVYTDEDLKRTQILTPEDQAKIEALRKTPPAMAQQPATGQQTRPADAAADRQTESLGEIARRYRKQKGEGEALRALPKERSSEFHLEMPSTSLAAPVQPGVAASSNHTVSRVPVPGLAAPRSAAPHAILPPERISPFQPRRLPALPVAPVNPPAMKLSGNLRSLQVQRGDSLWILARRYLGRGSRWPELLQLNPELATDPGMLRLGSTILVPKESAREDPLALTSVTLHKGDTLWSLARAHFGRGAAWACIARANPQLYDFERLAVGLSLQLPSACPPDPANR